jgi:acyl-coenzyme A thioesterase PaaI-like protein
MISARSMSSCANDFYNRNYVGCHFGGSLFAMTDPFWMMMVMRNLDQSYTVWDKSAEIEFLKPGRGTVSAHFRLTGEMLDEIRLQHQSRWIKIPAALPCRYHRC